jgi:hypothetical protein
MQNSPTRTSTTPAGAALRGPGGASEEAERGGTLQGRVRLRVLLLGANLWALCALWPALAGRGEGPALLALSAFSVLPLALWAALGQRMRWAQSLLLFIMFPVALAAVLALRPEALNAQLYGPLGMVLLAVSLCGYGAAAAASLDVPAQVLSVTQASLGADPWDAAPAERGMRQRVFIAMCVAGAGAIALVAPAIGGTSVLERAWGDAAGVGAVLSAVVAAALGVAVLAIYMPNALRAKTGAEQTPRGDSTLRVVWFLFLALLGAITYFVVQP